MYTVLVVTQVLVAISLIGLVLIQHGKGADAGAAFGSGASGTVFGARGAANFLTHITAALAAAFFICSLALAYLVHDRGGAGGSSVVDELGDSVVVPGAALQQDGDTAGEPAVVVPGEEAPAGSQAGDAAGSSEPVIPE